MEPLTKKEMQLKICEMADELFAAPDWAAFKSRLRDIMLLVTSIEYPHGLGESFNEQAHFAELILLRDMGAKYIDGEKVAIINRRRSLKSNFAFTIHYAELPGEALGHRELSELSRKVPQVTV